MVCWFGKVLPFRLLRLVWVVMCLQQEVESRLGHMVVSEDPWLVDAHVVVVSRAWPMYLLFP